MQHRGWSGALRKSGVLASAVTLFACGGDTGPNGGSGSSRDGEAEQRDDAGALDGNLPGDDAASTGGGDCNADSCAQGQRCDRSSGEPTCVASCEGFACGAGLTCTLRDDQAHCVVPCSPACGSGQRCEVASDGTASCVDNSCDFLACGAKQVCVGAGDGSGSVCADNSCDSDLDCDELESCSAEGACVADVCTPGVRTCDGAAVRECASNGGSVFERVSCPSSQYSESQCSDEPEGAACSCRDDWDCPAYTDCVQGSCAGTGRAPTCFLPPLPFADLLPRAEPGFPWGGNDDDGYKVDKTALNLGDPYSLTGAPSSRDAVGHPFPHHAQASTTPVVANLTDDNGDGRIDELDAPEIVFTSFCDRNYFNHGVLRALHGGGPRAGQELFAVCENKLWREGDALVDAQGAPLPEANCTCNQGDLEPTGALAVGDLDGDGVPEIVLMAHAASAGTNDVANNRLVIFRNTGELISSSDVGTLAGANPAVTLANLDGVGLSEVVVGPVVFQLGRDANQKLVVTRTLTGSERRGVNGGQGPVSCVADLDADGLLEVVAGGSAYRVPAPSACPAAAGDIDGSAYCANKLVPRWSNAGMEGFCAVADVLPAPPQAGGAEAAPGPEHPLDGAPEVVLVSGGRLRILNGATGTLRLEVVLDSQDGGPPNIDDFDGDGFPEIGTAFATRYVMHDLQPATPACPAWSATLDGVPDSSDAQNSAGGNLPRSAPATGCVVDSDCGDPQFACAKDNRCVCLHNGWNSRTQDASSRVTGSSVFDFNGDGAAEVVYNDECYFRIYEGKSGRVYQRLDSQSPTRIEYPVVADVDSDGNAEIVFSGSNARSESCVHTDRKNFINGIQVVGDPGDRWIAARRIWNQHAYHITNVLEDGRIPAREVPSWLSYGDRVYNTYRSNLPPIANVAPDLTVLDVQVTSPNVSCGAALTDELRIVARVVNDGDLRVGAQVPVRFSLATGNGAFTPVGTSPLGASLEPGRQAFVSLTHRVPSGSPLPTRVQVQVDPDGTERECREDNNGAELAIVTAEQKAELSVELAATNAVCTKRGVRVRVTNDSARAVPDALVRLYAGSPSAGGTRLVELHTGPLAAHAQSAWIDSEVDVGQRTVTVHAWVDPDMAVDECDDGNNTATLMVPCGLVLY